MMMMMQGGKGGGRRRDDDDYNNSDGGSNDYEDEKFTRIVCYSFFHPPSRQPCFLIIICFLLTITIKLSINSRSLHQELAGLGGDANFLKQEVEMQVNKALPFDSVCVSVVLFIVVWCCVVLHFVAIQYFLLGFMLLHFVNF